MKAKKIKELAEQLRFEFEGIIYQASAYKEAAGKKKKDTSNLDLIKYLAPVPENIFLVRVTGDSMIDKQIFAGDILVVDKNEQPSNGKIVISSLDGELTVKTLRIIDGEVCLEAANKQYSPIKIEPYIEFQIQGVVKHVIHIV